jgi:WhiB family redox-sensing transcriptional regulator
VYKQEKIIMVDWRDLGISKAELARAEILEEARVTDDLFHDAGEYGLGNRDIGQFFDMPEGYDSKWLEKSACKGLDPEMFIVEGRDSEMAQSRLEAARVCAQCAVEVECAEYSLLLPRLTKGVFGGNSENERRKIKANKKD